MIRRIEALNFRCLRYIRQDLNDFQILVGPNASGKTTFLDLVAFLGDLVTSGLEKATNERTLNFQDLVWGRSGDHFEIAIELEIPQRYREKKFEPSYSIIRYEVSIGIDKETKELSILAEKALLKEELETEARERTLFPMEPTPPLTILSSARGRGTRLLINKVRGGNDNFYSETYEKPGKGWAPSFKLGPRKSALGNLPADESKFPVTTWLKSVLTEGVQKLVLNSLLIRKASPPGQVRQFKSDGSNLPWVIDNLYSISKDRYNDWIKHLQTALPDIENIHTVERPEDRHRYLVVKYKGGLEVPSWMTSDGTLRLLALTLPAYLTEFSGIYLIEEPENGIHPKAVETVFQSLSSVYEAQILIATHSTILLSIAQPQQVLCFTKTEKGAADIVRGDKHPALSDWKGETNLSLLFAGGVLG